MTKAQKGLEISVKDYSWCPSYPRSTWEQFQLVLVFGVLPIVFVGSLFGIGLLIAWLVTA